MAEIAHSLSGNPTHTKEYLVQMSKEFDDWEKLGFKAALMTFEGGSTCSVSLPDFHVIANNFPKETVVTCGSMRSRVPGANLPENGSLKLQNVALAK